MMFSRYIDAPGGERMLVTQRHAPNAMPRRLRFTTVERAREFLRASCRSSDVDWRGLLHAEGVLDLQRRSDADVLEDVAQLMVRGRVVVGRGAVQPMPAIREHAPERPEPVTPARAAAKTWLGVRVLCDLTGRPVPDVRLRIIAPGGAEFDESTARDGRIEVRELVPGTCTVACRLDEFDPECVLGFVRVAGDDAGDGLDPLNGAKRSVAQVDSHRVRAGETLASLAAEVGCSADELVRFNFGTDDPEAVRFHMQYDVGCVPQADPAREWVFSDTDEPGLLMLPRPWERSGLATGRTHAIRVRVADAAADWTFSI